METLEIILIITRILLYVVGVGVLIYFVLILKEIREIAEDVKNVAKVGRNITASITSPINSVVGLLSGITKGINTIRSIFDDKEEEYEEY